ncbi:MAG: membrane protein insertion efficiency factor YidD [Holosporales bacterium]|nr:membrane protein insertion efficiency factor YidD [Holosporales bacterium]
MLQRVFLFLIRAYQALSVRRVACCRFIPSCSQYSYEAIKKYGAFRGIILSFRRISRCRPGFGRFRNCGYDPVP